MKVFEWALVVGGLVLAGVFCFVLAAFGAYVQTRLDLPPVMQAALIVLSPMAGIWLALVLGAKVTGGKRL